ncbi:hypothetical protein D083_1089 [Dickeya solani RNS 08.23.3.1.A]|nr:hypothetical protein D083_1089 [Dickeya solani RNS 08.23.3.1.A]
MNILYHRDDKNIFFFISAIDREWSRDFLGDDSKGYKSFG